ncbi:VPA1269 family protein [Enterobacter hormaechei]|uniref:VPA1269 family protein n=1 Tax=Enterobacter cloacae complex sp. 2023EL-00493 TaxID=3058337 RepID=UPI00263B57B3|nr:VPA1269 family protein [Enterobacter cloacae complex sp. 2023EL-00493]MDN4653699.1 VPA1269 family protein [Enterobacter cloacae complex sp. 2023EL-00493]MDP5177351.1 VPA1269 family protein [Enterobacter hormaechei]
MLTTLGAEWRQWQELAAKWMATQTLGISDKREALGRFFESYIAEHAPYAISDLGNDSNLLIVFYVQIMPDDFVMQLHRF